MQSTRKSRRGLSLALLSGIMLVSSTALHSKDADPMNFGTFWTDVTKTWTELTMKNKIAILAGTAAVFRFNQKRSCDDPARYDRSKLNKETLLNNPKEFFKHLWYFIDDAVIGRAGKSSSMKVKVDKTTGEVETNWDPGAEPQGFGGYAHSNIVSPFAKTIAFPVKLLTTFGTAAVGFAAWKGLIEGTYTAPAESNWTT